MIAFYGEKQVNNIPEGGEKISHNDCWNLASKPLLKVVLSLQPWP